MVKGCYLLHGAAVSRREQTGRVTKFHPILYTPLYEFIVNALLVFLSALAFGKWTSDFDFPAILVIESLRPAARVWLLN